MPSPPTSVWTLEHPKMTMKGSSGKSPGQLSQANSEKASSGKLTLPEQSCHLRPGWAQAGSNPCLQHSISSRSVFFTYSLFLANCSLSLQPPLLVTLCPELFSGQPLRRRLQDFLAWLAMRGLPQARWDQARQGPCSSVL